MALALKYRPKRFEDLIGQDTISQTLSLALDTGRLGHAYLFSGLRGSGKTSTARIFAKALICEKGTGSSPCETCDNCTSANAYRHIDIIEMDAASNRKIDDIRDMIEQTKYKPSTARYKIFIIDEVHMLTREAFNALLKTLEEPPGYVKFILATTDPLKLPPTILSRTQHFSFKKIAPVDIVRHLEAILNQENIEYEPEALEILARSGSGSVRDTLTLLDQAIIFSKNSVDVDSVVRMLGILDPAKIENMFEAIMRQDMETLRKTAQEFESYDPEVLIEDIIEYLKRKFYEPTGMMSPFIIERFFRIMAQTKSLLGMNADNGFALTLMMFKMLEALKSDEISQQIHKLQAHIGEIKPSYQNNNHVTPPEKTPPSQEQIQTETVGETIAVSENNEPALQKEAPAENTPLFMQVKALVDKIYDRDMDLGRCFDEHVEVLSFEDGVLRWMSCAEGECKKQLRTYWSVIRHLIQEVFGLDVKIESVPCDESKKKTDTLTTPPREEPEHANEESSSMIEDVETGSEGGSCMENNLGLSGEQKAKEFNGTEILNDPFVKKAIEIFDAQKIKIRSKV